MCAASPSTSFRIPEDLPDYLRDHLDVDCAAVCAFNPFGTLLAVGNATGHVGIWEMELLSQTATMQIGHERINQIDWSDDGHVVVITSGKTVTRVQLLQPHDKRQRVEVDGDMPAVALNGGSGRQCVVSCAGRRLQIVDFGDSQPKIHHPELNSEMHRDGDEMDGHGNQKELRSFPMAAFDRTCKRILNGREDGWIVVYDVDSLRILELHALPSECSIVRVMTEKHSDLVFVFAHGMCPMVYALDQQILSQCSSISAEEARKKMASTVRNSKEGSVIRPGMDCLKLKWRLKHPLEQLNRLTWNIGCPIWTGSSGEAGHLVCAPSPSNTSPFIEQHLLHIWNLQTGELEKILEGPRDSVTDLCWHEACQSIVSVSLSGKVFIWSKRQREYWSTFDPNFQELEENEEYIESETEFDLKQETSDNAKKTDSVPMEICEDTEEEIDIFGPSDNHSDVDDMASKPLVHLPIEFKLFESEENKASIEMDQPRTEPESQPRSEHVAQETEAQENTAVVEDHFSKGPRLRVHFRPKKLRIHDRLRRRQRHV